MHKELVLLEVMPLSVTFFSRLTYDYSEKLFGFSNQLLCYLTVPRGTIVGPGFSPKLWLILKWKMIKVSSAEPRSFLDLHKHQVHDAEIAAPAAKFCVGSALKRRELNL